MRLSTFAALLLALLVLSQAGLALWRYAPIEPSAAPVFSFPAAASGFNPILTDRESIVHS